MNAFRDLGSASGIFSAAWLQAAEFPPINWIVPDVLPEGLTILAGKPKMGKSWLALDMALAVAAGGNVLGRDCEPGPVLCLALEDNQRRLQRRLRRLEPHLPWPDALEFHTRWPRLDAGGLERIGQWIGSREGARLAIVDTLATIRPASRAAESAHGNDYAALRGLHQLASENNVGVLVIHHLRKSEAEDPFDAVSGSTGLTGAADTTLIMTRREGDGGAILYGRGRDLEEFETAIDFDAFTCRWRDPGDPVAAFAGDTRQAILAAIRDGHASPSDIANVTGIDSANIRQTLGRMVRSGDIRKDGRGVYVIATDPLTPRHNCHNVTSESDNVTDVTGVSRANGTDFDAHDPDAWQ